MAMKITSITIGRKGYQRDSPFVARVAVNWEEKDNTMNVAVDERTTLSIIDIIAPLITRACAEEINNFALAAREAAAPMLEAPEGAEYPPCAPEVVSSKELDDDDVPF